MASELNPTAFDELRAAFAQRTSTQADDWFLVFKARYGMREVFSSVRDAHGPGSVITTLFTGCTAVDSIIAAGLEPTYAPIAPETLGIDAASLDAVVAADTRAILFQHSYGIIDVAAARQAMQAAHAAHALFVEDSAHCLARLARDADGLPLADVSVHSFGIEKTFSSLYFGGAIWVNPSMADKALHDRIVKALASLAPLPSRLDVAAQRYRAQVRALLHLPAPLSRILRARLLRRGAFEPPVADVERQGGFPYESYQPSAWIVQQILPLFATLDADEANRRACIAQYLPLLDGVSGVRVPAAVCCRAADQPLIRLPLVLPDEVITGRVRSALAADGLYAVDWYHVPFYPGALDLAPYRVAHDAYDAYCAAYGGTIGLPTDIDPSRVPAAVDAVRLVLADLHR